MTRDWFEILSILTTSAALALASPALASPQDAPATSDAPAVVRQDAEQSDKAPAQDAEVPDAPKTDAEPKTGAEPNAGSGDIQLDENAPVDGDDEKSAVAQALDDPLDAGAKENTPEELLNLATEMKLSASNLLDLSKVVALCQEAKKKGLDETNAEFANQLELSARLDRGLALAQLFMNDQIPVVQYPRGWEALRDKAIEDLEAALAESPDLPLARLAIGRLYVLAEKNDKAKEAFEAAFGAEDADAEVKAVALKFRADLESDATKAIAYLERAIEAAPDVDELRARLASYFLTTRDVEDALAQIDKALEISPDNADFKKAKAQILAEAGKIDEAKALFEEATKDADDNILIQIEKGQFLASIDETDAAIAHFTKLCDKFDGPGLYYFRAVLYLQKKDFDKAKADVDKALRKDPNLLAALNLKGVIYLQQEKYDDAIRIFERLRRKSDDKDDPLTQIAFATSKKGLYAKAAKMLNDELAKKPDSTTLLRSLADIELSFGHWEAAAKIYDRLLELAPEDSGVLNNYSWLLSTCPDESARDGERALKYGELAAKKTYYAAPHILSTLAAAYAELGDFDKAREWSAKAVELGEKENRESLEDLKKELESYKENKPWREEAKEKEVAEPESEAAAPEQAEDKAEEKAE